MRVPHREPAGIPASGVAADGSPRVRIQIWDASGTRCLEHDSNLPELAIEPGALAEPDAIVRTIRTSLGIDSVFLRVSAPDLVEVESIGFDERLPSHFAWSARAMTPALSTRSAWQRPGWMSRTLQDVDDALRPLGIRRVGPAVQVRHTSVTGMLRIDTDAYPLWLKSVPAVFAHEAGVVRWLAAAGFAVPDVVAATTDWWLAREFPAEGRSPAGDPLADLAQAQLVTATRQTELHAVGCPRRPIARLADELTVLLDHPQLLDDHDRQSLARRLPRIGDLCGEAASLGFPETLVHGDLSPGNVRWTGDSWLIFDWTDACVTHPFVELASPLSYETDRDIIAARTRTFAAVWEQQMPHAAIARALDLAPALGAAHLAVSYLRIVEGIESTGADQAGGARLAVFLRYWLHRALSAMRD